MFPADPASLYLDPTRHVWLQDGGLCRIFAAFAAQAAEARVVGGAVRNALLGLPVADIDLAVNLPPEQAEAALQQAGIKVVRTGFAHGTVTAVVDGRGYEITSLRRDVTTDGRRATIAYTDAWEEDAARRDFTMNALYAAADGTVYDYHDGIIDLRAGRIRFIGDALARIAEDYLRILRFFRFQAYYGRGEADPVGLAACAAAVRGLNSLSRERVTQEWKKILLAADPLPVLRLMQASEILPQILPLQLDLECLQRMLAHPHGKNSGFSVRLAALLPADPQLEFVLQAALRLSNAEASHVLALCRPAPDLTARNLPETLYRQGKPYVQDRLLLQAAMMDTFPEALWTQLAAWQQPVFPLRGQDLLALGVPPSENFGTVLRQVEEWWLAAGFKPDHGACLAEAKRRLG